MSARNAWHFRLRAYEHILCQAFRAIPRETGPYFNVLHTVAYVTLPIDWRFVCWLCSCVYVSLWNDSKSLVYFQSKREWLLNLKINILKKMGCMRMVKLKRSVRHLSQPPELQDPTASSSTSTVRKWKKCLAFFGIFYSGLVRHFFKITIQLRSVTITWLFTAINKSKLWKAAKL